MKNNNTFIGTLLNPYWITGFIDAEGCFRVNIYPNENKKLKFSISFTFHISQKEKEILELILKDLNMGQIVWDSQEKNIKKYMLSSLENCLKLINFLDQYPLQTSKFLDYKDFKEAILFWSNKNNQTLEGLIKLKEITKNMNNNRNLNERHNFLMNQKFNLNPYWIIGFIDGEGCFYCYIQKNTKSPLIQLSLELSQSTHDWLILNQILQELSILKGSTLGRLKINEEMKKNLIGISRLIIMNNSDLEILIKFIDQYPLKTKKLLDYEDLKLLRQLKKEKVHLTEKGLEQMKKIKEGMNFGRNYKEQS
jgi:hypothetical protein